MNYKKAYFFFFVFSCLFFACTESTFDGLTFDEAVTNTLDISPEKEISTPEEYKAPEEIKTEEDICIVRSYKVAPGFTEFATLDPRSNIFFPGALIDGNSITDGSYRPLVYERKPITISTSLTGIEGTPVITVDHPNLSNVRTAINELLSREVKTKTPAQIFQTTKEVHSTTHLKVALEASYNSGFTKVNGMFDFERNTQTTKIMSKYMQIYYTLDVDPVANPSDFFKSAPDPVLFEGVSPVYISSVSYGRMLLFSLESTRTNTEVQAAVEAVYAAKSGSISTDYREVLDETTINVTVLGGSSEDAVQVVTGGADGIAEFIKRGAEYGPDSPGVPLAYKMSYLRDNSLARLVLSSEYQVRKCRPAYLEFEVDLIKIKCTKCEDGDGSRSEARGFTQIQFFKDGKSVGKKRDVYQKSNQIALRNGDELAVTDDDVKIWKLEDPDKDNDYFFLDGTFLEHDAAPDKDDSFGSPTRKLSLAQVLKFMGSKTHADITLEFKDEKGRAALKSVYRLTLRN